jgi:SH3-like domain-containing protein
MSQSIQIKILSILCSSALLMAAGTAAAHAGDRFPYLAEVSKESVNVRAGPNTNFEKIDKLSKGAKVVVLGRNFEWFKVQPLPTTAAFIRSDYLKKDRGDLAVVLGENVNVRCQASSSASSLGEIKKDTLVRVTGQVGGGWSRVEPPAGSSAWIHQDFLKEISSDVPSSLLTPVILRSSSEAPEVKSISGKIIVENVSLQGMLTALASPPADDVHYEIIIDDKSVYYLQDIPSLSYFSNTAVVVEGTVIPDPQKTLMHPRLHINKIELVL